MRAPLALLGVVGPVFGCTGCASEPEIPLVPAGPPPTIVQIAPAPPTEGGEGLVAPPGAPVVIQLRFTTVGNLHQGFFADPPGVRALGAALGACTPHAVDVDVVWSQDDLEGRIFGQIPAGSWSCAPRAGEAGVDLEPLVPATKALARYRDTVAGMSDFRISSFLVGVDVVRTTHTCRIRAIGQHPPDGTRFHPCPLIDGKKVCADGDPKEGVTRFTSSDRETARLLRDACGG